MKFPAIYRGVQPPAIRKRVNGDSRKATSDSWFPLLGGSSGGGGGGGGPTPVTCGYALNDNGTMAAAFGYSLLPTDASTHQVASYTYAGTGNTYIALPADVFGVALPRPTTYPVAAQLKMTSWPTHSTGDNFFPMSLLVAVFDISNALAGYVAVGMRQADTGTIHADVNITGTLHTSPVISGATALNKSVSVYVLPNGGVGWTADGQDRGILPTITVRSSDKVVFGMVITDSAGAGIGKTVTGQLITPATSITEPMPSGTTDVCGNVIPAQSDPYFANVVSLMHFNGAVGDAGITDVVPGVVWNVSGVTPSLTDAQKKFGPTSLLLDSSTYISTNTGGTVGTGAFTLEGWFYEQGDRAFMQIGNLLAYHSGGSYHVWSGASNIISTSGAHTNSWVYVVLKRDDLGNVVLIVNDQVMGAASYADNMGAPFIKLGFYNSGNPAPLYIDEFRATFGVARSTPYTPYGEFPNS